MKKRTWILATILSVAVTAGAAPKGKWVSYKSNLLSIEVTVPSDWAPTKVPKALAFHYDDQAGSTAAFGILKSEQIASIEDAANREYDMPEGRPDDWVRSAATLAGHRAIKITGSDKNDSAKRIVHYFVEAPSGIYIIQCIGSADRWNTFGPIFSTILTRIKFL